MAPLTHLGQRHETIPSIINSDNFIIIKHGKGIPFPRVVF